MAEMTQIDAFMASIRRIESGSFAGNYQAVNRQSGARGAYQIMPQYWDEWARAAGLQHARWTDPRAQDAVARHRMGYYFSQLGDWRLVAIAWFAGMSRAKKAKAEGIQTVGDIKDVIGTSVAEYVDRMTSGMGEYIESVGGLALDFGPSYQNQDYEFLTNNPTASIAEYLAAQEQGVNTPQGPTVRDSLVGMLDTMSNAIAGGTRTVIGQRMAPEIDERVEGLE